MPKKIEKRKTEPTISYVQNLYTHQKQNQNKIEIQREETFSSGEYKPFSHMFYA